MNKKVLHEQCPQTGGPATHWARSWYYAEIGQVIFPECEEEEGFEGGEIEKKQPITLPSKIMVSPNPANDEVSIAYSLPEARENMHLDILDNAGIRVKTVRIKDGKNNVELPVHDLPAGIYFVHILSDRQTILSEKFIILK